MKKTTSFHLEQDILEEIEAYKDKYNLSSRNVALERMLLERRNVIYFQAILTKEKKVDGNNERADIIKDKITRSIDNCYSDMPE